MNIINTAMNPVTKNEKAPGLIKAVAQCKCPRCRRGDMFKDSHAYNLKSTMKMNKECPVCKQPFELEVGFYYGSGYISYALCVALSVASFIAWWVFIGIDIENNKLFYWLGVNALLLIALQPILMRIARNIWLAIFVSYDPQWETNVPQTPERINKDQGNNW